jgi:PAS domain S-box-containing protein
MEAETPLKLVSAERLLHSASDGVFVIDRNRRYVLINKALERMTGYDNHDLVEKDCMCFEVLDCRDEQGRPLSAVLCPGRALFEGGRGFARQRCQLRRKDGSRLWIETIYTPVSGSNGEVEYVFGLVRDITDAKAREEELLGEIASLHGRLAGTNGGGALRDAHKPPAPVLASGSTAEGEHRLDPLLARCEREAILRALGATHGQRNKAAQLMGISRSRLYRRMEALGVDLKAFP